MKQVYICIYIPFPLSPLQNKETKKSAATVLSLSPIQSLPHQITLTASEIPPLHPFPNGSLERFPSSFVPHWGPQRVAFRRIASCIVPHCAAWRRTCCAASTSRCGQILTHCLAALRCTTPHGIVLRRITPHYVKALSLRILAFKPRQITGDEPCVSW